MKKGFTLVEIMIVVAILGLLVAIGVPGFLKARNKSRNSAELANLKAVTDNIASYGINESSDADDILRLWPTGPTLASPASYIRKQLFCPIDRSNGYTIGSSQGSCDGHGIESTARAFFGQT